MINQSKTKTSISSTINKTLSLISKKSEVASVISTNQNNISKNQISPQLDSFENKMIKRKKYK